MAGGGIDPDPVWREEAGPTRVDRRQERDGDGWGLRRRWLGLRWRQDWPAAAHHGGACGTVLGQRSRGGGSRRLARAEAREAPGGGEVQARWPCSGEAGRCGLEHAMASGGAVSGRGAREELQEMVPKTTTSFQKNGH
ncbi:hypothetical protein ZWY2020_044088 [Hordeum vulgare]|nr:hypothetical protein ZWY2020_044088 [Hordeum vulgare]